MLIYLAAATALFGMAVRSDRAAVVLVASLVVAETLMRSGVEFDRLAWIAIDAVAIAFIARRGMPRRNWAVLALFPVAWAAYYLPQSPRDIATTAVVIAQFLLTFPLKEAWCRAKATNIGRTHPYDDFDLLVRA